MSRYTGPRLRKVRALGSPLPNFTSKHPSEKKQAPPGQHGPTRMRNKASTYKEQMQEKQKIRFNYGLSEKQLRRYFEKANHMRGNTGENLLLLLEARLDNVLFRAGFAPTIPAARQLVNHGHVTLNGKKVDICSCGVSQYDVIQLREKVRQNPIVLESIQQAKSAPRPPFLEIDDENRSVKMLALPSRQDVLLPVKEIMVVEFYSH